MTQTQNLTVDVERSRFRDASWFDAAYSLKGPIVIGGAGGIGSWLGLLLSRVLKKDHTVVVYDHDIIEEVNLAGQLFRRGSIGKRKASEIRSLMMDFSGSYEVHAVTRKYDEESYMSPIMFSCFDNMEARKAMFSMWKAYMSVRPEERAIFIDGRLLAEQFQVLFVTPEKADKYEKEYLFDDSEVEDANCSYKQTTHFAANIAAKMVQGFTNWLANDDTVEVPFYYEEIGGLFYSSTNEQ